MSFGIKLWNGQRYFASQVCSKKYYLGQGDYVINGMFVCLQNNRKSYGQISMKFSGKVLDKFEQGTKDSNLVVIQITVWIQGIFNGFFYHCIHQIASGRYYGFYFVMLPPPQCVEKFHHCFSDKKNIIDRLRKFPGYIHNCKMLPGNIFGLIVKKKMAATGISLSVMKIAYISLIIGLRGFVCEANL